MLTRAGAQREFTRAHCEVTPWSIRAERNYELVDVKKKGAMGRGTSLSLIAQEILRRLGLEGGEIPLELDHEDRCRIRTRRNKACRAARFILATLYRRPRGTPAGKAGPFPFRRAHRRFRRRLSSPTGSKPDSRSGSSSRLAWRSRLHPAGSRRRPAPPCRRQAASYLWR